MAEINLKLLAIILAWCGVLLFAIIITIIRKRRSEGLVTVSPLDVTRTKKEKRGEVAKELLFLKVHQGTTNFKRFDTRDQEDVDMEEGRGSSEDADENSQQSLSNACAICLEEFEEGEKIARSVETQECKHIFHESCIQEVISAAARKENLHIPCPCCRQTFVELEEIAHA